METLLAILSVALPAIEAVAPSVAKALTGGQSAAEAIEAARKAAEALPEREQHAGDTTAGAWDADLRQREAGGTGAPSVPADPYGSGE